MHIKYFSISFAYLILFSKMYYYLNCIQDMLATKGKGKKLLITRSLHLTLINFIILCMVAVTKM